MKAVFIVAKEIAIKIANFSAHIINTVGDGIDNFFDILQCADSISLACSIPAIIISTTHLIIKLLGMR